MTAETDLLPLPEPGCIQSEAEFVYGYDREDMEAYARACVAHATAAKDAEIEALRAEVERLSALLGHTEHSLANIANAQYLRAERLAEALREAADMLLADYPETAKRLHAALHPTAAQENDDA